MNATGHGTGDEEDGGWNLSGSGLDPVIPSTEVTSLKAYIKMQLISGYHVTEAEAQLASEDLSKSCVTAAQRVSEYAKADLKQRRRKLPDDEAVGVRMEKLDEELVRIKWTHPERGTAECCELWQDHFDSLSHAYLKAGHDPKRMLTRIFVMVLRYETLTEVKSAYQAALPKSMLQTLQDCFGVRCECFASPLNRYCDVFCSLFLDTDHFFGSRGSFFDFRPKMGSFEVNPPFDQMSVVYTFKHIFDLLKEAEQQQQPLSFVMCCPQMDFNENFKEVKEDLKKYTVRHEVARRGCHSYLMGLQHRQTGDSQKWVPTKDSNLYWLQNREATMMWPATTENVEAVMTAFV